MYTVQTTAYHSYCSVSEIILSTDHGGGGRGPAAPVSGWSLHLEATEQILKCLQPAEGA